ncbi:MAG: 5'/3'-nucleotidase SurE [Spirochaetaceae bacterium]|nr:MAG: 5'/3'-nucleotidase SurE [Spirochaetaceae bacterium]
MSVPRVLIVNDDGIHSPGLLAAVEAVQPFADVLVAAPTRQQTASGRAMTGNREDTFHAIDLGLRQAVNGVRAWHIDASPALVVQHALAVLCPDGLPDLVVSGINYGENLSTDIGASGTVGAAFEAAIHGIPAIAVSRQTGTEHHFVYGDLDWSDARRVLGSWVKRVLEYLASDRPGTDGLPFDVLKIDVPDPCPPGTEERVTQLAQNRYLQFRIDKPAADTPLKASLLTIEVDPTQFSPEDDVYAFAVDRVVAVTPLTSDWTAPLSKVAEFFRS